MTQARKWEYKTVEVKSKLFGSGFAGEIDEELNRLGLRGWELVSGGHDTRGFGWFFFLKRPRS